MLHTARLVAAIFGIVGCGASCGSSAASPPGTSHALQSVTVTEHLDTTHTVSSAVNPNGGTVSTVDAKGIKFIITFPAQALPLSEKIQLTPISALDRMPLSGGLNAGVHMAPEGTVLFQPATLTIEGVSAPPAGRQLIGFGYAGSGQDFHYYPIQAGTSIVFRISHFSSVGVGTGSPQEAAAFLAREMAALDAYKSQVVLPRMALALKRDATFTDFMAGFIALTTWENRNELLGETGAGYTALLSAWLDALPAMVLRLLRSCFQHYVNAGLQAVVLIKIAARAGLPDQPIEAADRCLRFKVDFDTRQESQHPLFNAADHLNAFGAPVELLAGTGGTASLNYVTYTQSTPVSFPQGCSPPTFTTRVQQNFEVKGIAGLDIDKEHATWTLTDFALVMKPGKATETITSRCPVVGSVSATNMIYNNNWDGLHGDEQVRDHFEITGWTMTNGSQLFAQKSYDQTAHFADVTTHETTVIKIWHTPEGSPP